MPLLRSIRKAQASLLEATAVWTSGKLGVVGRLSAVRRDATPVNSVEPGCEISGGLQAVTNPNTVTLGLPLE